MIAISKPSGSGRRNYSYSANIRYFYSRSVIINFMKYLSVLFTAILLVSCKSDSQAQLLPGSLKSDFTKQEVYISMRDGVKLFTAIYTPKDASAANPYPFLMERTPYGCNPYGGDAFPRRLGPNSQLQKEKYIFVYQDVRGRYKSGGSFEEMTPAIDKKKKGQTDESSDTYDTVDWLLKNITGNNGRVGIYGISYPGFYASAALPDAHPAIKAVSPQAPVTDEFMGDDANHNGAFFLLDNFSFMNYFGGERSADSTDYAAAFKGKNEEAYQYYLKLGPLKNTQSADLYNHKIKIWNEYLQHDTYDDYWKARNIRTHLKNVKPAVLVVGGMFDAEDMFGAQRTYEAIEKQSPQNNSHIVLGPWSHGAWGRSEWTKFGQYSFGRNINPDYQKIETAFFNYNLKNIGTDSLPEATVFFTGTNEWKQFAQWPPANINNQTYYLNSNSQLAATSGKASDTYISDPAKPVSYIAGIAGGRRNEYLADDQKFATKRSDVLSYISEPLPENTTIAGRIHAALQVSLDAVNGDTKTLLDADFIVKVIDVVPDSSATTSADPKTSGLQRLVRAEVFRGKFRNSYEKPEGFMPGKKSTVQFDLNDASHTFLKGHRMMVQVQSSWFPIVDRNPQKFMRIPDAEEKDFQPVKVTLYHEGCKISLPVVQ